VDLEKMILGAMLLDKNAVEHASEVLKPYVFYLEAHQTIFTEARPDL
jgi:replicative DNA helicase